MQDLRELAQMVIQGLESGLHIDSIVKALMLSPKELETIEDEYPEIALLKRTGQLKDYLELYELTRMGSSPCPIYTHRAKTVWRTFYPQEEDTTDEERIKSSAKAILDIVGKKSNNE